MSVFFKTPILPIKFNSENEPKIVYYPQSPYYIVLEKWGGKLQGTYLGPRKMFWDTFCIISRNIFFFKTIFPRALAKPIASPVSTFIQIKNEVKEHLYIRNFPKIYNILRKRENLSSMEIKIKLVFRSNHEKKLNSKNVVSNKL